jgi:REP element-mobilizing transposase RayT
MTAGHPLHPHNKTIIFSSHHKNKNKKMDTNFKEKKRRSIRLKEYDYSQEGMYFITICTHQGLPIFGKLDDEIMILNDLGKAVQNSWDALSRHFPHIQTDLFVIMPNHIHGIINIHESQAHISQPKKGTSRSLGSVVRCFKICVTKWAHKHTNITDIWQRNYYEHVVRDDRDYQRIAEYIEYNPMRRMHDEIYQHD